MATQKMNVLVYSGTGSTTESVRHCLYTLRRLLSPTYAVITVTGDAIIKEPWTASCALLVFPGGADLGYCKTLNGAGNRRIKAYVNGGGSYLGFCAGGYYGSSRCEFEANDPKMGVVGDRELGFYPGICRGLAFSGFVYNSEAGARAADLQINRWVLYDAKETIRQTFKSYYNGGGVFVDAKKFEDRGVETLASYTEDLHVDAGEGAAAVVYRKVGQGHVVLTGPHPEFAPNNLSKQSKLPAYGEVIDQLSRTDDTRKEFMRLVLGKLGLKVNEKEQAVPSLSRLHLSAHKAVDVSDLVATWGEIITVVNGEEYVLSQQDYFQLEPESTIWGVKALKKAVETVENALPKAVETVEKALPQSLSRTTSREENIAPKCAGTVGETDQKIRELKQYTSNAGSGDQILDYSKIIKKITIHDKQFPSSRETPSFHHDAFFANLYHYHSKLRNPNPDFGKFLLYGEVLTSTNTLIEKNPSLLRHLPQGLTIVATQQVAGRGRGSNVWVSPLGALMFSTVMHHDFQLAQSAPIVFLQYICALATVRGIKHYAHGYDNLKIKLKWPNDIYAQVPGSVANPIVKIGGILVNSSYSGTHLDLVCGIGVNLANALPTTSLNQLAEGAGLKPFTHEKLLASIVSQFESLYTDFCNRGFSRSMEEEYYDHWLHTNQIVTLETHDGIKAKIKGITRDWGMLLAEELGFEDRPTGRIVQLQSDSNSFDFFKGLVRRKI